MREMKCIGNIYRQKGNIDSALYYHYKALKLAEGTNIKLQVDLVYGVLAQDYIKQKSYKKAKEYSNRYLDMLKKHEFDDDIPDAELLASQIDSSMGNFKDAYEHYKQYIIPIELYTKVRLFFAFIFSSNVND